MRRPAMPELRRVRRKAPPARQPALPAWASGRAGAKDSAGTVPSVPPSFPHAAEPPALPETAPEISVIIAHLNQPELLGRCLAALEAQSFDMARAEIIVVDNGSRVLPEAVIGRFPGVALAREPVPGPGPRATAGWRWRGAGSLPSPTPTACPTRAGSPPSMPASHAEPSLEILGGEVQIFPETPGDITPAEAFQMLYAYRQELYITRQNFSVTANLVDPAGGLRRGRPLRRPGGGRGRGLGPARHPHRPPHRLCPGGARAASRPPQHGGTLRHLGPPRDAFLSPAARGPARPAPLGAHHPAHGALAARGDPGDPRAPARLAPRQRWLAFRGLLEIRLYRAFRMAAMLAGGRDGAMRWNR